jgi:glyoxylase-like metal-dependent hydrolase (beta-lactamase superfamily II)
MTQIDFTTGAPITGNLDADWIHGAAGDPPIQVHQYDEHTVILRQGKSVNYEAPFMFLLFGSERALLLDTGATADPAKFPLRATVDRVVASWLDSHPRDDYQLVVAHTHGHHDHVAADGQFAGRPATTVVPRDEAAVRSFFGFGDDWPAELVSFELGGRVLELIASPGHHKAAITTYDPWTGILLTGDTVLPGRLYAYDFPAFLATIERLTDFAAAHAVTHVLGCHVEMASGPGAEFPLGARYQPGERPLPMTVAQLTAVRDAAHAVAGQRGVHPYEDFIIYNEPRRGDSIRLLTRGLLARLRPRRP